jgi:hypothetical protein
MKKTALSIIFTLLFMAAGGGLLLAAAQDDAPQAELPVLITACGQSPDSSLIKAIFMRAKLEHPTPAYELILEATPEDLKAAADAGRPFKSMMIIMGASLKGMGAAGISIEDELERTEKLVAAARGQGISIIGVHIGGMKRRAQGADPGDNTDELSIDAVAPNSDFLIINQDGNEDGRFTVIAKEKQLAILTVVKNLDLLEIVKQIYGQKYPQ